MATLLAYQQLSKSDQVWPTFIEEPLSKIIFYNSSEIVIPCKAKGSPKPSISWIILDPRRTDKEAFINLRSHIDSSSIRSDGSLVFTPYSLNHRNFPTHLYRCIASNPFGSLMSRSVHIKTGKCYGLLVLSWVVNVLVVSLFSQLQNQIIIKWEVFCVQDK